MNADIQKYRVWNGSEYMNTETIFLLPSGELGFFVQSMGYPHYRKFNNQNNFTIEQCTGLIDQNGNLIYEGDIVKGDIDFTPDGRVGLIRKVVFKLGSFLLMTWKGDFSLISDYHNLEIIGNIHEMEKDK